jgi:Na+-translocating ferredoxin:NAD+ oxidoreductase subunit G
MSAAGDIRIDGATPPSERQPLPVMEPPPQVPSWRLLATLGGAGAIAGLLIVLSYAWAAPQIEATKSAVLRAAIEEVLQAPARADTLWLHDGALVPTRPDVDNPETIERVFRGFDRDGSPLGYAITASQPGFADRIEVIFGYDPATRELLGMKILGHKETPGLGDKIVKPSFTQQFAGRLAPLTGVKGAPPAGDRSAVVMITGATISSRTIIREINDAVARWQPLIETYQGGTP